MRPPSQTAFWEPTTLGDHAHFPQFLHSRPCTPRSLYQGLVQGGFAHAPGLERNRGSQFAFQNLYQLIGLSACCLPAMAGAPAKRSRRGSERGFRVSSNRSYLRVTLLQDGHLSELSQQTKHGDNGRGSARVPGVPGRWRAPTKRWMQHREPSSGAGSVPFSPVIRPLQTT